MMIQTQSPDTRKAENAEELKINKFLLKEWCGMEVMCYRISLGCWACRPSAQQPCLKRGHYLDVHHTNYHCRGTSVLLLQQGDPTSIHLNVFEELHGMWDLFILYILILSLCPLTHNWVWVLYTWYLTDLFLRNPWDGSSLSKIKHFSRPWISLLSCLYSPVEMWNNGLQDPSLLCYCHRCRWYMRIVAASQELNTFGFPFLSAFMGARDELKPGVCPSRSATCAGTVNNLSHPSTDSGQSMKPLLSDRRGAESCHQPEEFPRGERPCAYQKGWSPSKKKKFKK